MKFLKSEAARNFHKIGGRRQYDFIVACEVVEHLFDPHMEIGRLSGMLCGGGVLGGLELGYALKGLLNARLQA